MDVRKLVVLGLLRSGSQNAYQLNLSIARQYRLVTDMKPPTTYKLLERLAQEGDVVERREQVELRPDRKIYSLTPKGEQAFQALLREHLATPSPFLLAGAAGLLFIEALDPGEAAALLRQRLDNLRTKHEEIVAERAQQQAPSLARDLARDYQLALIRASEEWLADTIRRLE